MTSNDVRTLLAQLNQALADVDGARAALVRDIQAVERTITLLTGEPSEEGEVLHGKTRPIDIEDCQTQIEAARLMALRNGGILLLTPASKMILAAGLSEGKLSSVRSSLHNRMSTSDEWEYLEPGEFRYLGKPTRTVVTVDIPPDPEIDNIIWSPVPVAREEMTEWFCANYEPAPGQVVLDGMPGDPMIALRERFEFALEKDIAFAVGELRRMSESWVLRKKSAPPPRQSIVNPAA